MFTTVIWATDGSPAADHALSYARSIAAEYGARLVVGAPGAHAGHR